MNPNNLLSHNMSLVAKPAALLQQLETALNQPRLARFKNAIFVLVLIHYWSRLYSKVLVRGPTRAVKDAYAHCLRVSPHRPPN
jgi:sphinganine-1-phosphate aldolase